MKQIPPSEKDTAFYTLLAMFAFATAYWAIGLHTDVYRSAALSAIFEILWIPAALCALTVPIAGFVLFARNDFPAKFAYLILAWVVAACILSVV